MQREAVVVALIGNGIHHHALHAGARLVVAKGGAGGEHHIAGVAVGLADGVQGCVNAVEQPDLLAWQSAEGLAEGLAQAVVFGIDRVVLGWDAADRLHHLGARPNAVFVEVQAQQAPASLQRSAVALQLFHLAAGRGELGAWIRHHIRSRLGMPSRLSPSLRVSAAKRHKASLELRIGSSALSTGTWS